MNKYKKCKGFTLVEVLICVGIIGIIAAISIPALLSSTNEKALEAQRKAFHSRMAQAFAQIKNLKLYEYGAHGSSNLSGQYLITAGISKVIRLTAICDSDSLDECDIPDSINDYYSDTGSTSYSINNKLTLPDYNGNITLADIENFAPYYAGFKTANGESVLLWYNPKCRTKSSLPQKLVYSACVNMIYDLNGKNGAPNSYGEDIGYMTVFYPNDPVVVAPVLYNKQAFNGTYSDMLAKATELELVPPTLEELVAILINKNLTEITKSETDASALHWSATYAEDNSGAIWAAGQSSGTETQAPSATLPYFLVKK